MANNIANRVVFTGTEIDIMSRVVNACSKKWQNPDKRYLCDCDSNWMTSMYFDYNNYISSDTFIENEIMPLLKWDSDYERFRLLSAAHSLLSLFNSVGECQPTFSYKQIGETCIKILQGKF